MSTIGIRTPIRRSASEGFFENTGTSLEAAQSNLRNLMFCAPGERLMHPDFGASPKKALFENNFDKEGYKEYLKSQVAKFLPYITIQSIKISTWDDDQAMDPHQVKIKVWFIIKDYEDLEGFVERIYP